MIHQLNGIYLRLPEPEDVETLYQQKNAAEVANRLGGFGHGYTRAGIQGWIERNQRPGSDVVWIICDTNTDECIGHVGLYQVDIRAGGAEFGVMIGNPKFWGKGIGEQVIRFAVNYGFQMLRLERVSLSVLANNERAIRLYEKTGFVKEGQLRRAQYKNGEFIDLMLFAILRSEWS